MTIPVLTCYLPGNRCLNVLKASIEAYAPEHKLIAMPSQGDNFGDSYNRAMNEVFQDYDEIIISNDDVVITPYTMPDLMSDLRTLKARHGHRLGLVGTHADNIRWVQNIKAGPCVCREIDRLSPLFTWFPKRAFMEWRFPPLNWYADDVICEDLARVGYHHYISKAYVHHVGSQSVGTDIEELNKASMPWLIAHRPEYLTKWFGGQK